MNIQMVEGKFYDNTYSAVWSARNKYLGVIVVTQEVTERKKAEDELKETLKKLKLANEELRRLDQKKDDFLSNVSHELKTPMISVMGYRGLQTPFSGEIKALRKCERIRDRSLLGSGNCPTPSGRDLYR